MRIVSRVALPEWVDNIGIVAMDLYSGVVEATLDQPQDCQLDHHSLGTADFSSPDLSSHSGVSIWPQKAQLSY